MAQERYGTQPRDRCKVNDASALERNAGGITRLADFHASPAGYFHVVDHLRAERHHDLDYS
jgi:hypothetical protein